MDVGLVALAVGALLAAGIGASLLAGRLRLPGLVLVLVLGMVIGSDGLTLIDFQRLRGRAGRRGHRAGADPVRGRSVQRLGGDQARRSGVSIALATLGTLLTAGITAIAALWLVDELTGWEALHARLDRGRDRRRRRVRRAARIDAAPPIARTLEGESGVNDPVAILLVIGCIEIIKHDARRARRRCGSRSPSSRSARASDWPSARSA